MECDNTPPPVVSIVFLQIIKVISGWLLTPCFGVFYRRLKGSGMRYGTDRALMHWLPERATAFPWATLLVNCVGCFIVGLGTAMLTASQGESANSWRLFLLVGLCGGLTTFSTFAMQSIEAAPGKAFLNVGLVSNSRIRSGISRFETGHKIKGTGTDKGGACTLYRRKPENTRRAMR